MFYLEVSQPTQQQISRDAPCGQYPDSSLDECLLKVLKIFRLPQLEIIDLSKNYLKHIPDEIAVFKSLRVLSVNHNQIRDIPPCLGNISTIRILKLYGNPLIADLMSVVRGPEGTLSPATPAVPDNEKMQERETTERIIEYLRRKGQMQDGPLETPRALSRFPVHPNDSGYLTSGSESASAPRSPGFSKSSRSHHRMNSSQYSASPHNGPRRPGLAPLALGNERNRSNSESVLQATQNNKSKRMGMVKKKHTELEVLDENRANRNSFHLRGQSHSSALKNVTLAGDPESSDEASRYSGQKGTFLRPLSSVPEQKQPANIYNATVEGAKGVLYSLHLIQPYLAPLVSLTKKDKSRRSSLEGFQLQLEHLDQSVLGYNSAASIGKPPRLTRTRVCSATRASIDVYIEVAGILLDNLDSIVSSADPKHIRTLMLMLYGSWNEQRNARRQLAAKMNAPQDTLRSSQPAREILREQQLNRDDALTPTQDYPKPERRWRNGSNGSNGTNGQHSFNQLNLASMISSQRTTPSHSNLSSRSASRSNSRAGFNYSSVANAVAGTPRSGDSFASAGVFLPRSRNGSISTYPHRVRQADPERLQFERILDMLDSAVTQGLQLLPSLEAISHKKLDTARRQWLPMDMQNRWTVVLDQVRTCAELSKSLKRRLQYARVPNPEVRTSPDLWQLQTRFVKSYTNLLGTLREAQSLNQVDPELRNQLRPIHKTLKEVSSLIKASPWDALTEPSRSPSAASSRAPTPVQHGYPMPPPIQTQMMPPPPIPPPSMSTHQHYQHRRPNGSGESATSLVTSPNNGSVPATPLSAALGPAAQATIPSTPATAGHMSHIFSGNVFQRADNLLQGQTMFKRPGGVP